MGRCIELAQVHGRFTQWALQLTANAYRVVTATRAAAHNFVRLLEAPDVEQVLTREFHYGISDPAYTTCISHDLMVAEGFLADYALLTLRRSHRLTPGESGLGVAKGEWGSPLYRPPRQTTPAGVVQHCFTGSEQDEPESPKRKGDQTKQPLFRREPARDEGVPKPKVKRQTYKQDSWHTSGAIARNRKIPPTLEEAISCSTTLENNRKETLLTRSDFATRNGRRG